FADANCQAAVPNVLGGVSVSDNCSATNAITLAQSPLAGTLVGLGTNTITVTATDAAGNSATCTTSFVVTDNTAPTVVCSATPSAFADANCQAAVPNVLGRVSVSDNCSPTNAVTLTQSPLAGTLVGLGTNTITVTATDAAGNNATCQAAVPNVLGGVSVSDNCSPTNAVTLAQSPLAGTLVVLGTNTITVTATVALHNALPCTTSFVVTDNTAPTVVCSATPSAFADANCQAAVPNVLGGVSVSDNCSATNAITLAQSLPARRFVGLGTNTITVTATDAAGNSA